MKRSIPQQPLTLAAAMLMALSSTAGAEEQKPATDSNVPVLPEVKVRDEYDRPNSPNRGYQTGIVTSAKTKQLAKDIPQAITTVTEQLMLDSNSDTMKNALRHVAGLTFNSGEGGRIGDNIMLRGFYSFGDLYLDGIRDVAQYNRETFHVEQIDVLRGSAAMLFGRGQAGGVINRVSKQPGLVDRTEVSATVGSYDYGRVTADVNKVVGENAALRISAMKTDAGSSRRGVESEREGIAPTLRWGIGTADEFSIGHLYYTTKNVPDYGVPFISRALATPITRTQVTRRPLDVSASAFYGTSSDYEQNDTNISTGIWTHRFSQDTELRTVARFADYKRDLWAVAPRLPANVNSSTVTDATVITRGRQARGGREHTVTLQSDLTTKFELAGTKHEALFGVELLREKADRWSYTSIAVTAPTTTVGNPDPDVAVPAAYGNRARFSPAGYEGDSYSLYAQDQIEFIPKWKLLLGLRHDRMDADYKTLNSTSGVATDFNLKYNEWSYRSGLLYQPTDLSTYYLAWSDSFNPTADLYQLNNNIRYDAERSRTVELGTKWELFDGALSLRTALYRATKFNERNTDLEQANSAVLSKERHTDGFEIEAAGRITPQWDVFGGIALMRAEIDDQFDGELLGTFAQVSGGAYAVGQAVNANQLVYRGKYNPNSVGATPRNTPDFTFNLWTTYRFMPNWRAGVGIEGKGSRLAYGIGQCDTATQNANSGLWTYNACAPIAQGRAPSFVRTDLMLAYEQPRYDVRLNVLNVFNKRYYEALYENGGFAVPGTERAFQLTVAVKY
ncbi:MAG: TonB-dependent receptor [Methyloversatilis discipulorum]|uniref:TonB-dependent receptor n=1 Tax=Methyloversatilis discipulorum TaxID=1119528 RepID=UPI0026E9D286|nr:TonB-dependent receptor [Methyloversatilis discipulorum]MBV5285117.1 TonB-dependent receptor [Methyloversatilis discipulorum]